LCSILRAGLPLHGLLNYFDNAENGFVFLQAPSNNDDYFDILVQYQADLNEKNLLIVDPMLAWDNLLWQYTIN
jgi:uracil phosphoribosyltransferase